MTLMITHVFNNPLTSKDDNCWWCDQCNIYLKRGYPDYMPLYSYSWAGDSENKSDHKDM